MANERERTIWEIVFSTLAATAGTMGVTALAEALKNHAQTAVTKKANDLINDTGRPMLMRDLMALVVSSKPGDAEAGENVRLWLIRAQRETANGTITEGEIVNLLNKISGPGQRVLVLRGLGKLPSYEDFIATMGILRHDNVMQFAIKLAERMRTTGGGIIDDDLRAIRDAVGFSLGRTAEIINTVAGAARPGVRNLTEMLRRIQ
jgi:hypothetical protein